MAAVDRLLGRLLATALEKTSRDNSNRMIRCIFSHLAFVVFCASTQPEERISERAV